MSHAEHPPLVHWECPRCGYDDRWAGYLLPDGIHWCAMCDTAGHLTLLRMTSSGYHSMITAPDA